jgi:hypothetical protein
VGGSREKSTVCSRMMLSVRWKREETLAAFVVFGKTRDAKSPGGGVETRAGVLR